MSPGKVYFRTFLLHKNNLGTTIFVSGCSNLDFYDATEMGTMQLSKTGFLEKIADYEKNPEWKYLGDKPALIDFYADWCGPCQTMAPLLEDLSEEYNGQINIYKVDTEVEQELAALFNIRSIPSLLFIPMDKTPSMAQGLAPKSELRKVIDKLLLGSGKESSLNPKDE